MQPTETQRHWQRIIASVRRRINAAAWLERFAPGVFASGTAAAIVFFALRRLRVPGVEWGWLVLAAGAGIAALVAWLLSRRAFFSNADARAFAEYHLNLDSRLSAAAGGYGSWPRESARAGLLRWKKGASGGWLAGAAAMVLAGLWLPVPATILRVAPVEKPPALAQTEEWLKDLAQTNAVDPQSLENFEAQAGELASKPAETQYTHSALEAADSLREQTAQAMQSLARNFEAAEAGLSMLAAAHELNNNAAEGETTAAAEEQSRRAAAQLDKALQGMREGALCANGELLDALQKLDAKAMRELSAEEAAKLAKQLSEAGKAVRLVMGDPDAEGGKDAMGALLAAMEGDGGDPARMRGNGGVSRGRGDAPLEFDRRESDAGSGNLQTVQNDDYTRAALGDKLGVQTGEHTVDRDAAQGPVGAGALAGAAQGGEAVWVNKLTPAEREALKEFFK